jgi:hypothetical protein
MYEQIESFNQSKAGKVAGMCEQNVRLGYGITVAKYKDAWANWEATDQHTEAIPTGVDAPCFFSYNGPSNGHIGVHLAIGKFWSDGVIYDSIAAFNENHTPIYVGWSTSVDGVKVIEEDEMVVWNNGDSVNYTNAYLEGGDVPAYVKAVEGQDFKTALYGLMSTNNLELSVQVNQGDQINIKTALGTKDNENLIGQSWKNIVYNYIFKNLK